MMKNYRYVGTEERLVEHGFAVSIKQIYPEVYIKQIDNKHILQVCILKPNVNIWSGNDSHYSRQLKKIKCLSIKKSNSWCVNNTNKKEWLDYEIETYVELNDEDIQDLIDANLVEVVE